MMSISEQLELDFEDLKEIIHPDNNEATASKDFTTGTKYDSGKPRPSLLPIGPLSEIVDVLEFGARKYAPNNWKFVQPPERYYDAAMRHIFAYSVGEAEDPETGLSHLAHAATCLMFLMWHNKEAPKL